MSLSLLVGGVIAAVATLILSNFLGYSTGAGYHLANGKLVAKESALLLKLAKIAGAGAVAAYLGPMVIAAGPFVVGVVTVTGVFVVLHSDINNWRMI